MSQQFDQNEVDSALAQLAGLRGHIPQLAVEECWVTQFHDVIEQLEAATSLDLRRFRIPPDQLRPDIYNVDHDGTVLQQSDTRYVGRDFYAAKLDQLSTFVQTHQLVAPQVPVETTGRERPRFFIVHGHDRQLLLDVKNFLQNALHLPEPIVLDEQANRGRTLIEKFEEHANEAAGAVVLLTPDDAWIAEGSNDELRRARQNVIFELGYFYGKFGRRNGRVLLLYKKPLDMPSDIAGISYIDVTHGVEQAGERIRREIGL